MHPTCRLHVSQIFTRDPNGQITKTVTVEVTGRQSRTEVIIHFWEARNSWRALVPVLALGLR
ncbi:hypothetical protein D6833_10360 [Candidatus Parcubacteria bacterium]|nr:MAG: hypothetical protein D6833_10360 [Candidatus Parcubacteria bacterium]